MHQAVRRAESFSTAFSCAFCSWHKAFLRTKDREVSVGLCGKDSQCSPGSGISRVSWGKRGASPRSSCLSLGLPRKTFPGRFAAAARGSGFSGACPALAPGQPRHKPRAANTRSPRPGLGLSSAPLDGETPGAGSGKPPAPALSRGAVGKGAGPPPSHHPRGVELRAKPRRTAGAFPDAPSASPKRFLRKIITKRAPSSRKHHSSEQTLSRGLRQQA